MFANLAFSLLEIESRGINHRDFRPDNMLIFNKNDIDYIVVSDFGISTYSQSTKKIIPDYNSIVGCYSFISPERFADEEGEKEDVWELGATLY